MVRIEPGGHLIRVPPGTDVLSAALAAGIPIPYSCRAGRCASCKSRVLSGRIEYPAGIPPGILAAEVARGEVLLCQARPATDLVVEARRMPVLTSRFVRCELLEISPLPLSALQVRVRVVAGSISARPGQFLDVRDPAGDAERLPVVASDGDTVSLECAADRSALRRWLDSTPPVGAVLHLAGPFDRPR
jgi:CDP-4-dehydro-6-deoxyglucose reductase